MGNVHTEIIEQKTRTFSKDWIIMKEIQFGGYRFDILAFNPFTKEIKIIEVDISHKTDKEKIKFAETLGEVEIVTIEPKEDKFKPNRLLKIISNPYREAILNLLSENRDKPVILSKIVEHTGLGVGKQGQFFYHLNLLLDFGLICRKGEGFYQITEKGVYIIMQLKALTLSEPFKAL